MPSVDVASSTTCQILKEIPRYVLCTTTAFLARKARTTHATTQFIKNPKLSELIYIFQRTKHNRSVPHVHFVHVHVFTLSYCVSRACFHTLILYSTRMCSHSHIYCACSCFQQANAVQSEFLSMHDRSSRGGINIVLTINFVSFIYRCRKNPR